MAKIVSGDCLEVMPTLPANSVDSIVTDPPYGLSFMGKAWDHGIPGKPYWEAALRVAKPGAFMLAFGGTRTYHRLACAIEDAGWEIRDCLMWVYGSGFPKSMDISKAIDKAAGAERHVNGTRPKKGAFGGVAYAQDEWTLAQANQPLLLPITDPNTDLAKQFEGYGTALKPAWEPIILAMKPCDGTFANNAEKWGIAGVNIDGCRVGTETRTYKGTGPHNIKLNNHGSGDTGIGYMDGSGKDKEFTATGRWPANLIHDGSEEVVKLFPQTGKSQGGKSGHTGAYCGGYKEEFYGDEKPGFGDSGSAARFFYCAKASKADRGEGNTHPTVKPTALMRYLCRLVTRPGGTVLDPFAGSGSTGKAANLEGLGFIGIELEPDYTEIAAKRITEPNQKFRLF